MIIIGIFIYNEEQSLFRFLNELNYVSLHITKRSDIKLIIVNDGSSDKTCEILKTNFCGIIINHPINKGIGCAIKTIIEFSYNQSASHIILLPGNGRVNPEIILKLVEKIDNNPSSYIVGNRFIDSNYFIKKPRDFALFAFNLTLCFFRISRIRDVTSSTRAFPIEMIAGLVFRERYYAEQDIHIQALKKKINIIEIPIRILTPCDRKHSHLSWYGIFQVVVAWLEFALKKYKVTKNLKKIIP